MRSLKGILSDLLGIDFLEEVLLTHSVAPRYSVISGKAVRRGMTSLSLAMLHLNYVPLVQRLEAELSLMDLVERSILCSSESVCAGLSLLKLFLCLDL
jgi:hypothetical protein